MASQKTTHTAKQALSRKKRRNEKGFFVGVLDDACTVDFTVDFIMGVGGVFGLMRGFPLLGIVLGIVHFYLYLLFMVVIGII